MSLKCCESYVTPTYLNRKTSVQVSLDFNCHLLSDFYLTPIETQDFETKTHEGRGASTFPLTNALLDFELWRCLNRKLQHFLSCCRCFRLTSAFQRHLCLRTPVLIKLTFRLSRVQYLLIRARRLSSGITSSSAALRPGKRWKAMNHEAQATFQKPPIAYI